MALLCGYRLLEELGLISTFRGPRNSARVRESLVYVLILLLLSIEAEIRSDYIIEDL